MEQQPLRNMHDTPSNTYVNFIVIFVMCELFKFSIGQKKSSSVSHKNTAGNLGLLPYKYNLTPNPSPKGEGRIFLFSGGSTPETPI